MTARVVRVCHEVAASFVAGARLFAHAVSSWLTSATRRAVARLGRSKCKRADSRRASPQTCSDVAAANRRMPIATRVMSDLDQPPRWLSEDVRSRELTSVVASASRRVALGQLLPIARYW